MQEDKIKLYEELLAADPGSRLFLPLARLYLDRGEADQAISTLRSGLNRYQEHFEARLLLHDTLREQGRTDEALEQMHMVSAVLRKYPAFWEQWAESMEAEGQADAAVAMRFVARCFGNHAPSWAEVLRRGIQDVPAEGEGEAAADSSPEAELDLPSRGCTGSGAAATQDGDEGRDPYRTKTMADILVSQGDYAQALDIYSELQAAAPSSGEREKLQARIDSVKEQLEATSGHEMEREGEQGRDASGDTKEREEEGSPAGGEADLIHNLEKLAERLENRG